MDKDPQLLNVLGPTILVQSKTNKIQDGLTGDEGATGERRDILTLDLDDSELIKRAKKLEVSYASYYGKIKPRQQKNLAYYLGRQSENLATDGTPIAANLIFEAEETFLPAALSKNPEPVVYSDNSPEGNKISNDVKTMLQYHADVLCLRRKLSLMTRQWSIYYLGVLKHGWDNDIEEIRTDIRKIQDFVFDPEGYVDVYGDFQGDLGERITKDADWLVDKYPEHKAYIIKEVDEKMGTLCTFTEWWTDEFCFATFKDIVLYKNKNQFFNYKEEDEMSLTGVQPTLVNHFAKPKKPYTFLSVFSLEEQPHDVTGLIEQNIGNQNLISRETNQIDYNVSRANNSTAYSENNFNAQTAKQASSGRLKGHPILVPPGVPISEAIVDLETKSVPDAFFKNLEMNQQNLRSIFGTEGISAQKPNENTTARGMILNQQYDNTRIGGGIGEALEQVADNVFNWWVQLYYVFYDQKHFGAIMGSNKAVEYIELSAQDLQRKLVVSVAPDSLKPKDELSVMNQALELFKMGALDPKTLFTILDFPDPQDTAENSVLFMIDKNGYMQLNFPEVAEKLQQVQQQQMAQQQAAQQQELQQKGAQVQQGMQQKEEAHKQKMGHIQQLHEQKLSLATEPASAALANVKIPK